MPVPLILPLAVSSEEVVRPSLPPIPPAVRAMLDAALDSGSDGDVATIVKYARVADPASADQVLAIATAWRDRRTAERHQVIVEASWLDLWTGKLELGGYITTGNSPNKGASATADLTREGLQWRQKFHLQGDYQETAGVATRKHLLASYEPNYKLDDRSYLYGQAQYESDRFFGYTDRVSTSLGAGYSAIKKSDLKLDVELGPAYRYTAITDAGAEHSIAARGSLDFAWKLSRGLSVTQTASAYVQRYNSTLTGTSAINAKLIGPLSAQLSYNVQYESEPPAGSVNTDTTSRAALVYSF